MSKKKSESDLPDNSITLTDGYNYGLDGFQFDTEYGAGVLDGARLPEVSGLAELPDGLVRSGDTAEEEDVYGILRGEPEGGLGDLSDMMAENSLAALGWLNGVDQDPNRLPKNPADRGIMELEKAWGVDRRTNGLLVPNTDRRNQAQEGQAKKARKDLLRSVRRAMRRSSYGDPLQVILTEVAQDLEYDAPRVASSMAQIRKEHGLAGNVFIYASAFPGLHRDKWKAIVRKKCASARYILLGSEHSDEYGETLASALKKKVVRSIPWEEAYQHYTPLLKASGRKVASSSDPREALRVSFLSSGDTLVSHQSAVVIPSVPVDRVSLKEAKTAVTNFQPQREVVSSHNEARILRAAQRKIHQLMDSNFLVRQDGERILEASADPKVMLQTAADLIALTKKASYRGVGTWMPQPVHVSREDAFAALNRASGKGKQAQEEINADLAKKALRYLDKLTTTGSITQGEAEKIAKSGQSPKEMMRSARSILEQKREVEVSRVAKKAKEYDGPVLKAAMQQSREVREFDDFHKRVLSASKESGIAAKEILGMVKWARRQMSDGVAGVDLTQLVQARFTKPLLKAASEIITELRKEHEGLSGHLYVDAEAYVTPGGAAGCEEGALKHRANGIPLVMKMAQCGSCVFNSCGTCQKYNKPLTDTLPLEDRRAYQKEAIRQANSSDAEQTASLFAPTYNAGEFGLTADSLEKVSLDETPEYEDIGDVLFGGIEL